MMTRWRIALAATTAIAVVGCTPYQGENEQAGTILGGILGGAAGSQVGGGTGRTVATVIGTLIGAQVGSRIGIHMDETDRQRTAYTLETTPTGQTGEWKNPDTGAYYTVEPTRTFDRDGSPCREYVLDAEIGGREEQVYGVACRQEDGNWKIQE